MTNGRLKRLPCLLLALGCLQAAPARAGLKFELALQAGHSEAVRAAAVNPSGRQAVTGDSRSLRFWDLETMKLEGVLPVDDLVTTLAYVDGGKRLALVGAQTLSLIDPRTRKVLRTHKLDGSVSRASLTGDGKLAAIARSRTGVDEVGLFNLDTGAPLAEVRVAGSVRDVALGAGLQVLAVLTDGAVELHKVTGGRRWRAATGPTRFHQGVAFDLALPDPEALAERVATASSAADLRALAEPTAGDVAVFRDALLTTYDAASGAAKASWKIPNDMIRQVVFTAPGRALVIGAQRSYLVDTRNAKELAQLRDTCWVGAAGAGIGVLAGGSCTEPQDVEIWDLHGPARLTRFRGRAVGSSSANANGWAGFAAGGLLLTVQDSQWGVEVWDLASARLVKRVVVCPGEQAWNIRSIRRAQLDPAGRHLLVQCLDDGYTLWEVGSWRQLGQGKVPSSSSAIALSPDAARVVAGGYGGPLVMLDAKSGARLREAPIAGIYPLAASFTPDGKQLLLVAGTRLLAFDAATLKPSWSWESPGAPNDKLVYAQAPSPDGSLVAVEANGGLQLLTGEGRPLRQAPRTGVVWNWLAWSPDGSRLYAANSKGEVAAHDPRTLAPLTRRTLHPSEVVGLAVQPSGGLVASGGADGFARLSSAGALEEKALLYRGAEDDWAIVTPRGTYAASRTAFREIGVRVDGRTYPFDQFDLHLNRPDEVAAALGVAPPALVAHLAGLRAQRLRRMGLAALPDLATVDLPSLELDTALPASTAEAEVLLKVRAAGKLPLRRLLAWVNGVPLGPVAGVPLPGATTAAQEVRVPLSAGRNKIELSVVDDRGLESLRRVVETNRAGPARPPRLFLLAVGVANYGGGMDLEYSAKDARDLAAALAASKRFAKVQAVTLTDAEATREAILGARALLATSEVDDEVVIFFAGHGLRDGDAYYFGTADVEFAKPSSRGLRFEEIEDLLDGVPARHRLVLIDTCFSGELEEAPQLAQGQALEGGVRVRAVRGVKAVRSEARPALSTERLRDLFTDLRRGSGATVIAAAGGGEFALETKELRNGVFTAAILQGAKAAEGRPAADRNGDGRVSAGELRDHVVKVVREATRGLQNPTTRRENVEFDFDVF